MNVIIIVLNTNRRKETGVKNQFPSLELSIFPPVVMHVGDPKRTRPLARNQIDSNVHLFAEIDS